MTLEQLRCLVALAEHGSFTRAAQALHLSQPALSLQIARLERELGVELLDRSQRPLRPTEVGERILHQARQVLEALEGIRALARGEAWAGPLRLGVIPTVGPYLLPRLLPRFREAFPGVGLEVAELLTPAILAGLAEGRLDGGLVATEEEAPGVQREALAQEAFYLYLAPGHPLLAREAVHPLEVPIGEAWVLGEGHCFREQVLLVCRPELQGVQLYRFDGGSLDTLVRLVDGVGGLTFLPEMALWTLAPDQRARVRPFLPPSPGRTLYLLFRRGSLKAPLLQALKPLLLATLRG